MLLLKTAVDRCHVNSSKQSKRAFLADGGKVRQKTEDRTSCIWSFDISRWFLWTGYRSLSSV
jgi:hypothetical protein